jgi:glycosyltransferase involved in cell wall biosynthesis
MNIYILPSYREGFPTGTLEAQSMGVPVITTNSTGCIDAIIEGRTGLRTKIDKDDIAHQIEEMRNKGLDVSMRESARQWVVNNFDEHVVWDEIEKLYM